MALSPRKGKLAVSSVVEGGGGPDGVILSLQLVGSGIFDVAYTLPVNIGDNSKTYSLQVDTGSSDLWVASSSCSTPGCSAVGTSNLYDPSNAISTGYDFNISYLEGYVSGPIVWDQVSVGGYTISNQALAAATEVDQEPLNSDFQGILGLALPLNSIIADYVHTVTGNAPDGAAWASNLFSITPVSSAPPAHFLSLSLSRPGSDRTPSLLGIGRHPSRLVSDPNEIHYSTLVSDRAGALYWKVGVRAITVYVNGVARPVEIGHSGSGMVFPTAVLDSGIPLILTTSRVANGIYGALGIGPGDDGQYYVPCNTPLNMTITLDDRPEIPLHPLDLTAEPQDNNRAQYCIGIIQADDVHLGNPSSEIGDMILGVPFLRNTYTVMAYTTPYENGTFPNPTSPNDDDENNVVLPHLGLLSLTNPTVALDEFNTVRLLNQPISSGAGHSGSSGPTTVGPKKLSIGVIVLVALIGFFSLCCALFGLRWYLLKRKFKNDSSRLEGNTDVLDLENKIAGMHMDSDSVVNGMPEKKGLGYTVLDSSHSFDDERIKGADMHAEDVGGGDDDGVMAEARPRELSQTKERVMSQYTASSGQTLVENASLASELGYGVGLGGKHEMKDSLGSRWSAADDMFIHRRVRLSQRTNSAGSSQPSMFVPLLSSPQHRHSQSFDTDGTSSPVVSPRQEAFQSKPGPVEVDPDPSRGIPELGELEQEASRSSPQPTEEKDPNHSGDSVPNLGELGYRHSHLPDDGGGGGTLGSTGSMAGIGTAAVARSRLSQFGPLSFPRESFLSTTSGMVVASATSGEEGWQHTKSGITFTEEVIHSPVISPPTFTPSGVAGKPGYVRPPSLLDDFDSHAGHPPR